jgi:hypothetical protein
MRGLRGVVAGALALIGLQALIATRQGPDRAAGIIGVITKVVSDFVDPRKPFLGERATPSSQRSGAAPAAPLPPPNPAGGTWSFSESAIPQNYYPNPDTLRPTVRA